MRLTTDLIKRSPVFNDSINLREIDLRGHNIPAIDNLGVANDPECIDFTDNDLAVLRNFPLSDRLKSLLCSRNRIATIDPSLHKSMPNLITLALSRNNIKELADLQPLRGFSNLTYLTLNGNPVAKKENYRLWVIWLCPSLRFVDYKRTTADDQAEAKELYGTSEEPTDLARDIMATVTSQAVFTAKASKEDGASGERTLTLTEEERQYRKEQLQQATTLDEIAKLEARFGSSKLSRQATKPK